MSAPLKINGKNLSRICGLNGLTVTALAERIGKSRMNVYRAAKNPRSYKPTFALMEKNLPVREIPNA